MSWGGVIQAGSVGFVEVVEQVGEEGGPVVLVSVVGVVALAGEDRDELGSGVEEAAAFANRFVDAVECGRSVAVAVAEEALVVGGDAVHDLAGGAAGELVAVVVGFDGGGDAEVFVGDGAVGVMRA